MKNKLTIVKIGGNIIDQTDELNAFLVHFATIKTAKILIHGGGKSASAFSQKLGIKANMTDGRRITSKEDLDIVTMIYAGLINKKMVAFLQAKNCAAIGLSGADANCIQSVKRPIKPIDFGYVGDVENVNSKAIIQFLQAGFSPVFCAITHDGQGQLLNTNADTVAAEIAIAMSKNFDTELIYCFEKKGVLNDVDDNDSVITELNREKYEQMKNDQRIHTGMLPKITNCFYALENGVQQVVVGNVGVIKEGDWVCTRVVL